MFGENGKTSELQYKLATFITVVFAGKSILDLYLTETPKRLKNKKYVAPTEESCPHANKEENKAQ